MSPRPSPAHDRRSLAVIAVIALMTACGTPASGPSDASSADGNLRDSATPDGSPADNSELEAAIPDAGVDAATDGGPEGGAPDVPGVRPSATSLLPCVRDADCNDGLACTEDLCGSRPDGTRRCTYEPVSSRCAAAETCDLRMGCQRGRACATNADCADMDPCTLGESCAPDSRTCQYNVLLDGDSDGFAPRSCGGPDCNDGVAMIRPGVPERCDGIDNNCNGMTDEGSARDLCGEGASCTSERCVLDSPVDYADIARACAFVFACDGTLRRGFGSMRTVNDCLAYFAGELPDLALGVQIAEVPSGSGTATVIEETGVDPATLRAYLARARTARTCGEFFDMSTTRPMCTVAPRDYLRCEGDAVRMGCSDPIPCRPGTHCQVNVMDTTMGSTHLVRATATCSPAAVQVPIRCSDGTMTDSRAPRCPMDSPLRCMAETACDGTRLSLCVNGQRYDLDCAIVAPGSTCADGTCR